MGKRGGLASIQQCELAWICPSGCAYPSVNCMLGAMLSAQQARLRSTFVGDVDWSGLDNTRLKNWLGGPCQARTLSRYGLQLASK